MSGAEDLARLTQTIDTANELFLSSEIKMVDVGGGTQRPTNAKVLADLSAQMSGAMIYTTVALGMAGTTSGGYFSVLSPDEGKYLTLYRNDSGEAIYIDAYPNGSALEEVTALIRSVTNLNVERPVLTVINEEGAVSAEITNKRLQTPSFNIGVAENTTILGDSESAALLYADDQKIILGQLEMRACANPGIMVVDPEGGFLQSLSDPGKEPIKTSPLAGGILFSPKIAISEVLPSTIYVEGLLPHRERIADVVATIASMSTSEVYTGRSLEVGSKLGKQAMLNLRPVSDFEGRYFYPVTISNVPLQSPAVGIKILFIGDSIANLQGPTLLSGYLQQLGINATFIGTLNSSANSTNATDSSGPLGETREGWSSGDFLHAITTRGQPVEQGGEAAYLAATKSEKLLKNPFIRLATGSDSSSDIRNGYVFDLAFYQSRFGLDSPDLVINALGTNDVRDLTAENIGSKVYEYDRFIHSQIKTAWPDSKIVRCVPATSMSTPRNEAWSSKYTPMIRAIQQAVQDNPDLSVTIAPLWAMTNPEGGYSAPPTQTGTWSDLIHPTGASRHGYYQAMAPFIAASALNLI